MKQLTISAVGVPWYTRANYKRVMEVMEDSHVLPTTFDKWLHVAEKVLESAKRQGVVPVKAHLDPETFPAWCKERGLNVDAKGRTAFANTVAAAQHQQGRA